MRTWAGKKEITWTLRRRYQKVSCCSFNILIITLYFWARDWESFRNIAIEKVRTQPQTVEIFKEIYKKTCKTKQPKLNCCVLLWFCVLQLFLNFKRYISRVNSHFSLFQGQTTCVFNNSVTVSISTKSNVIKTIHIITFKLIYLTFSTFVVVNKPYQ